MGRVVITHSTYLEGLIKWLKALSTQEGIETVTPAVLTRTRGRSSKLQLRVSAKTTGGYKLIAWPRGAAQEVFVITKLNKEDFLKKLTESKP